MKKQSESYELLNKKNTLNEIIIKKEEKNIKRQWKLNVGENNEQ